MLHKIKKKWTEISSDFNGEKMEQKIKQDNICIGKNIRRLRLEKKMGQTELVSLMQLRDVEITREALVKIERGIQHVKATQLKVIKEILNVSYDEIFKEC